MASTPSGQLMDQRGSGSLPTPRTLDLVVLLGGGARENLWSKDPAKMTQEERRHFEDEMVARAALINDMQRVSALVVTTPGVEPPRPKYQWDFLLEEARWYAVDVLQERHWKQTAAAAIARQIASTRAATRLTTPPPDSLRHRDGFTMDEPGCAEPLHTQPPVSAPSQPQQPQPGSARGRGAKKAALQDARTFSALTADRPAPDVSREEGGGGAPTTPDIDYSTVLLSYGMPESVAPSLLEAALATVSLELDRLDLMHREYERRTQEAKELVEMARAADEADERERRVQEEFDLEAALRSKRGRKRHVDEDPYGLAGLEPPRKKPVPAPKIGRAHPSASALTLDSQDDAEIAFLTRNNKRRRGREDEDDASTYDPNEDQRLVAPPRPVNPKQKKQAAAPPKKAQQGLAKPGQYRPGAAPPGRAPAKPTTHPTTQWAESEELLLLALAQEFSAGGLNWLLIADVLNVTHAQTGTFRRHTHCLAKWRQICQQLEGGRDMNVDLTLQLLKMPKQAARETIARGLPLAEGTLRARIDALADLGRAHRTAREQQREAMKVDRSVAMQQHESHGRVQQQAMAVLGGEPGGGGPLPRDPLAVLDELERGVQRMAIAGPGPGEGEGAEIPPPTAPQPPMSPLAELGAHASGRSPSGVHANGAAAGHGVPPSASGVPSGALPPAHVDPAVPGGPPPMLMTAPQGHGLPGPGPSLAAPPGVNAVLPRSAAQPDLLTKQRVMMHQCAVYYLQRNEMPPNIPPQLVPLVKDHAAKLKLKAQQTAQGQGQGGMPPM